MKICTYFAHRDVYDVGLEAKIRAALARYLAAGEELLIYFHSLDGFAQKFHHAAYRLRAEWPARRITLVSLGGIAYQLERFGVFGRVQPPPADANAPRDPTLCWALEQADVIFSYTYELLADWERRTFRLFQARVAAGAELVELAERSSALYLERMLPALPEDRRYVLEQLRQGQTITAIARHLGVNHMRVHELHFRAQQTLGDMLALLSIRADRQSEAESAGS